MIAVRTLVYFILSSLLNAVLGVVLVLLIHPGNPGIRKSIATSHNGRAVNILDSLLDLGRWYYILLPPSPSAPARIAARSFDNPRSITARSLFPCFCVDTLRGHEPFRNFPTDKSRILCSTWDEQRLTRSTLPRRIYIAPFPLLTSLYFRSFLVDFYAPLPS